MNDMRLLQDKTVAVGRKVFGDANLDDPRERAFRFGEEAMELLRACGLSFKEIASLLCNEFQRPAGEISQEIAGVQCTLFGLASAHKVDVYDVTEKEIERVFANRNKIRAKHDAKPAHLVMQKVSAA